jgi:hypothetical protein
MRHFECFNQVFRHNFNYFNMLEGIGIKENGFMCFHVII